MQTIKQVLIERDRMPEHEAEEMLQYLKSESDRIMKWGEQQGMPPTETLSEIEQLLADEVGLEPDYVMEIV